MGQSTKIAASLSMVRVSQDPQSEMQTFCLGPFSLALYLNLLKQRESQLLGTLLLNFFVIH